MKISKTILKAGRDIKRGSLVTLIDGKVYPVQADEIIVSVKELNNRFVKVVITTSNLVSNNLFDVVFYKQDNLCSFKVAHNLTLKELNKKLSEFGFCSLKPFIKFDKLYKNIFNSFFIENYELKNDLTRIVDYIPFPNPNVKKYEYEN
jgi:hypothetical protein